MGSTVLIFLTPQGWTLYQVFDKFQGLHTSPFISLQAFIFLLVSLQLKHGSRCLVLVNLTLYHAYMLLRQGTVVLVFQPAEEGGGGAKKMIDAGALENVDAIFGLHVAPHLPVGVVASRPGPLLAGSGFFEAVISGKGGHAALPQQTIDPLLAASSVVVSLQHLISREADPLDSQVLQRIYL